MYSHLQEVSFEWGFVVAMLQGRCLPAGPSAFNETAGLSYQGMAFFLSFPLVVHCLMLLPPFWLSELADDAYVKGAKVASPSMEKQPKPNKQL